MTAPTPSDAAKEAARLAYRAYWDDKSRSVFRHSEAFAAALEAAYAIDRVALAAWCEAVIDALVVAHVYRKEHDTDPKLAIKDLIGWHCAVALDPAVSSEARALVENSSAALVAEVETLRERVSVLEAGDPDDRASVTYFAKYMAEKRQRETAERALAEAREDAATRVALAMSQRNAPKSWISLARKAILSGDAARAAEGSDAQTEARPND